MVLRLQRIRNGLTSHHHKTKLNSHLSFLFSAALRRMQVIVDRVYTLENIYFGEHLKHLWSGLGSMGLLVVKPKLFRFGFGLFRFRFRHFGFLPFRCFGRNTIFGRNRLFRPILDAHFSIKSTANTSFYGQNKL